MSPLREQQYAEYMRVVAERDALVAERDALKKISADLLDHIDRETCAHETTHRGGSIWTICEDCGRKWADDEGGFKPHVDAPEVSRARVAL